MQKKLKSLRYTRIREQSDGESRYGIIRAESLGAHCLCLGVVGVGFGIYSRSDGEEDQEAYRRRATRHTVHGRHTAGSGVQ